MSTVMEQLPDTVSNVDLAHCERESRPIARSSAAYYYLIYDSTLGSFEYLSRPSRPVAPKMTVVIGGRTPAPPMPDGWGAEPDWTPKAPVVPEFEDITE